MPVTLRTVGAEDWTLWRSLRLRALSESPEAFGSSLTDWENASEDRWRQRLSIDGSLDLLAVDFGTDAPVGMATGVPDSVNGSRAEVISMWVAPDARGQGVASALLARIAEWAAGIGATSLRLSVKSDNLGARRAYEKNGFVESGPAQQRGEIVMVRSLDSSA